MSSALYIVSKSVLYTLYIASCTRSPCFSRYADNILRSYATAASIVLTFLVRIVVTGEAPALAFLEGTGMVLLSILLYSRGAAS